MGFFIDIIILVLLALFVLLIVWNSWRRKGLSCEGCPRCSSRARNACQGCAQAEDCKKEEFLGKINNVKLTTVKDENKRHDFKLR